MGAGRAKLGGEGDENWDTLWRTHPVKLYVSMQVMRSPEHTGKAPW